MRITGTIQLSAEKKVRLRLARLSSAEEAVAPAILEAGSAGAVSSSELSESELAEVSVSLDASESAADVAGPNMASISALASDALADTRGLSCRESVRRRAEGRSSDNLVKPLEGRRDVAASWDWGSEASEY